MTNCPNCGAVIAGAVCEYCGTRFGRTGLLTGGEVQSIKETLLTSKDEEEKRWLTRFLKMLMDAARI